MGEEEEFGFLEKKKTEENVSPTKEAQDQETDEKALKLLRKEQSELFGLLPPKENLDAKYIMLCFEICRLQ